MQLVVIRILFISTIFITFSCKESDNKKSGNLEGNTEDIIITNLKTKFPQVRIDNSILKAHHNGDFSDGLGVFDYYFYEGELGDTAVSLVFYIYLKDTMYRLDTYSKIFEDKEYHYLLEMSQDTLYFFKELKTERGNLIFISGEYNYRYKKGMFSEEEMMYYIQHKDSLSRVRGNNLPPLIGVCNFN
ncbi:MAG: hypothetical protein JXR60_08855 [Bacteroidales bacterium]|nr:hypothetical protein [Bacteroidales bacterium]